MRLADRMSGWPASDRVYSLFWPVSPLPHGIVLSMNSSVRAQPLPPDPDGQPVESRREKLSRIRSQVSSGYYKRDDVMRDIADALLMNPAPFENLNEKES